MVQNLQKNAKDVDTSDFAKKVDLDSLNSDIDELDFDKLAKVPNNLSSLKSKVDNLDTGKLQTTSADFSKLSYEVKGNAVKRIMLAKKVNAIDMSGLNWT